MRDRPSLHHRTFASAPPRRHSCLAIVRLRVWRDEHRRGPSRHLRLGHSFSPVRPPSASGFSPSASPSPPEGDADPPLPAVHAPMSADSPPNCRRCLVPPFMQRRPRFRTPKWPPRELAISGCLPARRPRVVLPHRREHPGDGPDQKSEGRVRRVPRSRGMFALGPRDGCRPRRLGRLQRGRAQVFQTPDNAPTRGIAGAVRVGASGATASRPGVTAPVMMAAPTRGRAGRTRRPPPGSWPDRTSR